MKWVMVVFISFISLSGYGQIELKSIEQTKELLEGKWNIYEYCVYEANYCKKDTSSSIIFQPIIGENKVRVTLLDNGVIKNESVVGVYDFIKVRTSDKYTLDNFLFSKEFALIVSFLDTNRLCLLQNSYQGYTKHYKRDTTYKVKPILQNDNIKE